MLISTAGNYCKNNNHILFQINLWQSMTPFHYLILSVYSLLRCLFLSNHPSCIQSKQGAANIFYITDISKINDSYDIYSGKAMKPVNLSC